MLSYDDYIALFIYKEAVPEWASQHVNPATTPNLPPKYRAPSPRFPQPFGGVPLRLIA